MARVLAVTDSGKGQPLSEVFQCRLDRPIKDEGAAWVELSAANSGRLRTVFLNRPMFSPSGTRVCQMSYQSSRKSKSAIVSAQPLSSLDAVLEVRLTCLAAPYSLG